MSRRILPICRARAPCRVFWLRRWRGGSARGLAPFTAISCDNLSHNGARLRDAVLAMAAVHDPGLAAWIAQRGAFPQDDGRSHRAGGMDDADIAAFAAETGIEDRALVRSEPFLQWVIEDRFCGPRPAFETLGVQLTGDVRPWGGGEAAPARRAFGDRRIWASSPGSNSSMPVRRPTVTGAALVEALWDQAAATLAPAARHGSLPPIGVT